MKRVVRNSLLGLLLCIVLTPVVSRTVANKYTMSDYMGVGAMVYVVQKHGPDAFSLANKMLLGISSGIKTGAEKISMGIITGFDYTVVPTYNYATTNGKISAGIIMACAGSKGIYSEFKKNQNETSAPSAIFYGLGALSGIGLITADLDLWNKAVGLKDAVFNYFKKHD